MDLFKLAHLDTKANSYIRSLKHYLTEKFDGRYQGLSGMLDVVRANYTEEEKQILKMYIKADPAVNAVDFVQDDDGECLKIWFE